MPNLPGSFRHSVMRDAGDLTRLASLASRLWPLGFHPGGLVWNVATSQMGEEVSIFSDGDTVVGFAAKDGNRLLGQADPSHPDAAGAIAEWFVEQDPSGRMRVAVVDANTAFRSTLELAGFARLEDEAPVYLMRRDASIDAPAPPSGYAVRSVAPHETGARVAVHQEAWNPHALPWYPDHRPNYARDAASPHSAAIYARVRAAPLYDPELDLVAVADDGTFAGCCIVWLDPSTGTAEIEPLGVIPAHRRRGVARALCDEAVRRVAAKGGHDVIINAGPNSAYPAPAGAYAKAGFRTIDRGRLYALRR
jgi:ribosomal protein S18 acetylase RimI-like enzyme